MKKLISFSLFAMIVLLALVARIADAQVLVRPRTSPAVVAPIAAGTVYRYRLHKHHLHIAYIRPIRVRKHRW